MDQAIFRLQTDAGPFPESLPIPISGMHPVLRGELPRWAFESTIGQGAKINSLFKAGEKQE